LYSTKLPILGSLSACVPLVYKILRGHHLHRLIDKNIERPDTDAENAEDWVTLSIQVAGWLTQCIDPDIANDLTNSGERIELADDFMYQLKQSAYEGDVLGEFCTLRCTSCRNLLCFSTVVQACTAQRCGQQQCDPCYWQRCNKVQRLVCLSGYSQDEWNTLLTLVFTDVNCRFNGCK
jgi:hypothetical protein